MLRDKAFNIAKNPKYNGYQSGLALMIFKYFDKKSSGGGVKSQNMPKQQSADELHKSIIRKFENSKEKTKT